MKLDVFNHFLPEAYYRKLLEIAPANPGLKAFHALPTLWNLDARRKLLDQYDNYQQILSLSNPPVELISGPDASPALARMGNDELAAICRAYPDRFPGFIASLPMNNPDASIQEIHRSVKELGARGIQLYTNVNGKPLSAPEFSGIFDTISEYDLPVWIHPMRGPNFPDYASEQQSEHEIWFTFGWPYETSACVARLIFGGIFDRLPNLKIITHHMGGMIPYFADKIALGFSQIFAGKIDFNPVAERAGLKKQPIDYFHMLYADTALNGSAASTRCGHAFFKTSHSLFATDAPFDTSGGMDFISGTMAAIEALDISIAEREAIYETNARNLMKL